METITSTKETKPGSGIVTIGDKTTINGLLLCSTPFAECLGQPKETIDKDVEDYIQARKDLGLKLS